MSNAFSLCLASAVSHNSAPNILHMKVNTSLGVSFAEIALLNDRALQFYGHS